MTKSSIYIIIFSKARGMDLEQEDYINSVNLNRNIDFPYLVFYAINDGYYPRNPGSQRISSDALI